MKIIYWKYSDLVIYIQKHLSKNGLHGDIWNLEDWNVYIPLGLDSDHNTIYLYKLEGIYRLDKLDKVWSTQLFRARSVNELLNFCTNYIHLIKYIGVK